MESVVVKSFLQTAETEHETIYIGTGHGKDKDKFEDGYDEPDSGNKDLERTGAPNIYAGKRNFIHQLMDVALLMANVSQLRSLLSMDKEDKYFFIIFAFICCSILLQVVFTLCMLIVVSIERKIHEHLIENPKEPLDEKRRIIAERLDNAGNILVLLIIVSNVFITGFGIEVPGIRGSENLVPQTAALNFLQNETRNPEIQHETKANSTSLWNV